MYKTAFISHSSKDKSIADNIVACLEEQNIPCWIAPRNIPAGTNYGAAISAGLRECGVFVLVYSQNSNVSEAVFREVQLAFECRRPIIPVRIENIPPSDDLMFFLSGIQWVDAPADHRDFADLAAGIFHLYGTDVPSSNASPAPGASDSDEGETEMLTLPTTPASTRTLRNADNPAQVWTLNPTGEMLVGRLSSCEISLAEPCISRKQCKIYFVGAIATVENLSSSNITTLNDAPIHHPLPLCPGDKIKCGRVTLIYEAG
ncbi:MAG: TIR domain-containing protein [Defluviitaleaceae bacterium]|nr:TIR domain-containing protein [Defluviitaleaceae bacterium]